LGVAISASASESLPTNDTFMNVTSSRDARATS
jgi:hypothetical protein